jgi:hypothetical protein
MPTGVLSKVPEVDVVTTCDFGFHFVVIVLTVVVVVVVVVGLHLQSFST